MSLRDIDRVSAAPIAVQAVVAVGQAAQENRQPLLRRLLAHHHHVTVLGHHLAADHPHQLALQGGDLAGDLFAAAAVGQLADAGALQRFGLAHVAVVGQRIHADDLAGQMEAEYLHVPGFVQHEGLQRAGADHVKRIERIAIAVERVAALQHAAVAHGGIQLLQVLAADAGGKAQLVQRAAAATFAQLDGRGRLRQGRASSNPPGSRVWSQGPMQTNTWSVGRGGRGSGNLGRSRE